MSSTIHNQYMNKNISVIILLVIALPIILTGCNLPSTGSAPETIEKIQVLFLADSIKPLKDGETIELTIVDEVTGIPYNQTRLPLEPVSDGHLGTYYVARRSTLVTYLFYKVSPDGTRTPEVGVDGTPIRYRMYHIGDPTIVRETIAGWADDLPNLNESGSISGTVVTDELGEPLQDILVSAGGVQAVTDAYGKFTLYPVASGFHTLVAISKSGTYQPAQNLAGVETGRNTPAEFKMTPSPFRDVTFSLTVPENTPSGIPLRLAGNLTQLGNTFADLGGGMSGDPRQMPVLTPNEAGAYLLTISLPIGIDIRYKYTLGDGFWNAEHGLDQSFITHQLILPADSEELYIVDTVSSWQTSTTEPVWFKAITSQATPPGEQLTLQFKVGDWLPALPMVQVGDNSWAAPLISPHNFSGEIPYRYCREFPCTGDNQAAIESTSQTRIISTDQRQGLIQEDHVEGWAFLNADVPSPPEFTVEGTIKSGFIGGLAITPYYSPTWQPAILDLLEANPGGYNHVMLSPAWKTANLSGPDLILPSPDKTISNQDLTAEIDAAHQSGLTVSLYPQILAPGDPLAWWDLAETSQESTWVLWLEQYQSFLYQYAEQAARGQVETFVIGGDWIAPALPIGDNFETFQQPGNIASLWEETIQGIRDRFPGKIAWMVDTGVLKDPPAFLSSADLLYIQWSQPVNEGADLPTSSAEWLDQTVKPLQEEFEIPIVLVLAIPSVQGFEGDCIPSPEGADSCLAISALVNGPVAENPQSADLMTQADYYHAILSAVSEQTWLDGVITQGYFPAFALHDASASIHGKPAESLFQDWLGLVLEN